MNYQASDIVKCSCKQLWFYMTYPSKRPPPTEWQLKGEKFQQENSKSPYREMTSFMEVNHKQDRIYFSVDEIIITKDTAVLQEYKSLFFADSGNYFNTSLCQVAYYATLNFYGSKQYYTASFEAQKTQKVHKLNIKDLTNIYLLRFGDRCFHVELKNPEEIMKFYKNKLMASKWYQHAEIFDAEFKFKEFEVLSPFFSYSEIEIPEYDMVLQ